MSENFVYTSEFRASSRPTGKLDIIEEAFHTVIRNMQARCADQELLLREVDKSLDEVRYAKGCSEVSVRKVWEAVQKISDLTVLFHQNAEKLADLVNRLLPVPQDNSGQHVDPASRGEG